jgi:hypothetical protein
MEIVHQSSPKATKSKIQLQYERLYKQVQKAEREAEDLQTQLDANVEACNKVVLPVYSQLMRDRLRIVQHLADYLKSSVKDQKSRDALVELTHELLEDITDGPVSFGAEETDQINSIKELLKSTFKQSTEEMPEDEREMFEGMKSAFFSEMMGEMTREFKRNGMQVDFSKIDFSLPEEEIQAEIKKRISEAQPIESKGKKTNATKGKQAEKAPTQKQMAAKEMEDMKSKGLSEIYKRLVKVIHPDLERDPAKQAVKEDWMKKLTVAYENNDLKAMLTIEAYWMNDLGDLADRVSEDKLKAYIQIFKDQLKDLKSEIENTYINPRYRLLMFFSQYGPVTTDRKFRSVLDTLQNIETDTHETLDHLDSTETKRKKLIKAMIKEQIEEMEDEMDFDDLFRF